MTGVEILAINEVVIETCFNWSLFGIVGGVIFGIMLLIGISTRDLEIFFVFILCGIFMGGFFGFLVGAAHETPVEYQTQYKVVISDEVLMSEFTEKYEVVNQEGKIYTIIER